MRRLPLLLLLTAAVPAVAQTFPAEEDVLRRIWTEGMDRSQAGRLLQTLTDSIGPRLTGSPGMQSGNDWLIQIYRNWGINARNERYGTWIGWRRGVTHIDLIAPRVRSLEGMLLAWSGGTRGRPSEGPTVILPDLPDSAAYEAWYPTVRGRHVLLSLAEPTCRPDQAWREFALPESFERMNTGRAALRTNWQERLRRTGYSTRDLPKRLEAAGARGIVTSQWSGGYGVVRIFQGRTTTIPSVSVGCEDYGLLYRLTENGQGPVLRIAAEAEFLGDVPVFNTVAEIRGSEKPDEYVMLSAHFDSWDGSSGATDNATGTITMLEAMRILKAVYPAPRRTILVGHWSGEEQGLNGSGAFAEDHPEVVAGLQALFNQDNGTGRVVSLSASGFPGASAYLASWAARLPAEIAGHIRLDFPGMPAGGGTDHASFVCRGAPGFNLGSHRYDYFNYTWHTNRDTFDKVVLDDLRNNAVLTAMLVYLASEEPGTVPRDRRVMPVSRQTGEQTSWPDCPRPARSFGASTR
jgi:carboxypeptidase Q